MFPNVQADLRAYDGKWSAQGFWVMLVYRFGRWRYTVRPVLLRKFFSIIYRCLYKLVQIVTGVELPCEAVVGRNFVIDHFGGIIISGWARFGDNCRVRSGIGNNVLIGANAVVMQDVPDDCIAVGIPAIVKPRDKVGSGDLVLE
jgi:serine O-acetyltransferase